MRGRRQLSDDASAYVRGLIMSGQLRPGASVRPEVIGQELQISATPAREALQALRVEGFLELKPGRGFIVATLTGQDIRDLFQAHALIAGELAVRATLAASDAELGELEEQHERMLAAAGAGDLEALEARNHLFHRRINLLAASPKILWVLGLVTRYVPRQFYSSIQGWPAATTEDHAELLEAMRNRDAEAARAAMHRHIVHSGELLADHFDHRTGASDARAVD